MRKEGTRVLRSRWRRVLAPVIVLLLCLGAAATLWVGPAQRGSVFTGSQDAQAAATKLAQTTFAGGLSVRQDTTQTITIPRAGRLTSVDVPLCTVAANSKVMLTVTDAAGKRLGQENEAFADANADCVWHDFSFHQPVAVHGGAVLTLHLAGVRGDAPLWGSDAYNANPYRGGTGRWMGHTINDFAFRVYLAKG